MGRPSYWKDCTKECEAWQKCAVCGLRKSPIGRSAPLAMANSLCDRDCPGYRQEPKPGHLWPGELADMDREEVEGG